MPFREGDAFEHTESRTGHRRIRLLERLTPVHWRAVGIDTGRQSILQETTLLSEYRPVEDTREPPAVPLPTRRAPGQNRGKPPKAFNETIEVMVEAGEPLTVPQILERLFARGIYLKARSDKGDPPGAKVVRSYLDRLFAEDRVEVADAPHKSWWSYRLTDPEAEASELAERLRAKTARGSVSNT